MAVPNFLNVGTITSQRKTGVTDVQTIMDDFATLAALNGWTNPAANQYKSPPDAAGRWFDVTFTRTTQQKLDTAFRDDAGVTLATRRTTGVSTNSWTVFHAINQYYFAILLYNHTAVSAYAYGGLLDLSPESQTVHTHYTYFQASTSTADVTTSASSDFSAMVDNVTATLATRNTQYACANTILGNVRQDQSVVVSPVLAWAVPTGGGNKRYAGMAYGMVMMDEGLQQGGLVQVPIDGSTLGYFIYLSPPATNGSGRALFARYA